jgi:serine/threonine protein kinase
MDLSDANFKATFFEKEQIPNALKDIEWSLDSFENFALINHGMASHIFKATVKNTNYDVALKIYRLSKINNITRYQLLREIEICSILDHDNIIQTYGIFKEGKIVVFVQEYCAKGDLLKNFKILRTCSSVFILDKVFRPIVEAVVYLHKKNIVHRDIKLENILIADYSITDFKCKICDFGLSIITSKEKAVTRVGTIDYMAPEVSRCPYKNSPSENKNRKDLWYCEKVDSYSLGVLCHEILFGMVNTDNEKIQLSNDIIEPIRSFLKGMLNETPRHRYSAETCLRILRNLSKELNIENFTKY